MITPRLLLISPVFHGYWRSIAAGFAQLGIDVHSIAYDALTPTQAAKFKLTSELPHRLGVGQQEPRHGFENRRLIRAITSLRPDVCLVIRGDSFDDSVYEAMEQVGATKLLWLYDELRRTRHTNQTLACYEQVFTYSPTDLNALSAEGFTAHWLPNAFDPAMSPAPRPGHEVVFIGARYPNRAQLLTELTEAGIAVRCFGKDWSRHPVDRLRTWRWQRDDLPAGRDVARETGYALTAGSPAALNIHHDQDGFTMRTFEIPGVGGLQLIDRKDVDGLYEPGSEVVCFDGTAELVDLCRRAIGDASWTAKIRAAGRRRTLADHTFTHRAAKVAELWA